MSSTTPRTTAVEPATPMTSRSPARSSASARSASRIRPSSSRDLGVHDRWHPRRPSGRCRDVRPRPRSSGVIDPRRQPDRRSTGRTSATTSAELHVGGHALVHAPSIRRRSRRCSGRSAAEQASARSIDVLLAQAMAITSAPGRPGPASASRLRTSPRFATSRDRWQRVRRWRRSRSRGRRLAWG